MIDHPFDLYKDRPNTPEELKGKMFQEAMKPIVVTSLNEIRMIIDHFTSGKQPLPSVAIKAELSWYDEKEFKQEVSVNSDSVSLYDLIMTGLEVVKKRTEAYVKVKEAVENAKKSDDFIPNVDIWDTDNMKFSIDYLIERRMGAKRNGLKIRWKISEGVFEYDPYLNKLYQLEEEDANKSTLKSDSQ
jgi:hypothetical protein